MPSTSRPNSKRDDSSASSIQMELEQLLSLESSENGEVFGTEALKDNTSRKGKSKKITYTKRADDSKDSNDDDKSKKSARSRRSRMSRASGRSPKKPTDETNKSESTERKSLERRNSKRLSPKPDRKSLERKNSKRSKSPKTDRKSLERKNSKRSKSPKTDRTAKDRRKIQYRSKETDTPEERDRDARSYRSKESKGSKGLRRSSHRKLRSGEKDDRDGLASSKRGSYRSRGKSPDSTEDNDAKPTSSRTSSRRTSSFRSKASRRKSWSFDDFDNNEWSSSDDEGDVEVDLNDGVEGEFRLNDAGNEKHRSRSASGERKPRPRRHNSRESTSLERIKAPQSNIPRSSSLGKLSSRRHSRKGSGSAMDVGMILGDPSRRAPILGDPSRRAPPTRSKSNDMFSNARFQNLGGDRKSLARRNSGNFAEYLRKQGLTHKSDRSSARTQYSDPSSVSQDSQDDADNPFEVTYHHSFSKTDNWDPFGSDNAAEENANDTKERRGNLRPTRSGGLLQTSSKDTISRLPVGAHVRKDSITGNKGAMACASMDTNELGDRDKQRRADYQKSIAAAAMAGRRLSSKGAKPTRRQTRTVRSSFDESVRQLEGALQSAQ